MICRVITPYHKLCCWCLALSDTLKQSINECWYKISTESACKTDTVRARDNRCILMRIDDDDDDIKHQEVRNRYYTQHNKQVYQA